MNSTTIILFAVLATAGMTANASTVYQCTSDEGVRTFSFTPCAPAAPENVPTDKAAMADTMERLADIDARTSRLQRQQRDLQLEYEVSLNRSRSDEEQQEITDHFERESGLVAAQISTLRDERSRLVEGSVAALAQGR